MQLAKQCDLVIIVGSPNSSNSNRLREVAKKRGVDAYLVDNAQEINQKWVMGKKRIGLSAGASAPDILVSQVLERLNQLGYSHVDQITGAVEHVIFGLPKELEGS